MRLSKLSGSAKSRRAKSWATASPFLSEAFIRCGVKCFPTLPIKIIGISYLGRSNRVSENATGPDVYGSFEIGADRKHAFESLLSQAFTAIKKSTCIPKMLYSDPARLCDASTSIGFNCRRCLLPQRRRRWSHWFHLQVGCPVWRRAECLKTAPCAGPVAPVRCSRAERREWMSCGSRCFQFEPRQCRPSGQCSDSTALLRHCSSAAAWVLGPRETRPRFHRSCCRHQAHHRPAQLPSCPACRSARNCPTVAAIATPSGWERFDRPLTRRDQTEAQPGSLH